MAARLGAPSVVVPNAYYAPDEAVALLGFASVTLGQRYHFAIQSVLAGTVPVCIPRGAKIQGLAAELGIAAIGSPVSVDADALADAIRRALENGAGERARLALCQRALMQRAAGNFSFLEELPPYQDCWPPRD
jgi:polysaccharide pyruvyl transferase WcaK-like protein